jgi:glycerol-3-phosphate dehydrogenase
VKICILGAGSWGTSLAFHLHNNGHQVNLWSIDPAQVKELGEKRRNHLIPEVLLAENIKVSHSLLESIEGVEGVVFAVPSNAMRSTALSAASHWPRKPKSCLKPCRQELLLESFLDPVMQRRLLARCLQL